MNTLYGLKNCDSCRKATRWLDQAGISYQFHDLADQGIDAATLTAWFDALGWERVLNKRSTNWRALAEQDKQNLDEDKAAALILSNAKLIKRPVLVANNGIEIGFSEKAYAQRFAA